MQEAAAWVAPGKFLSDGRTSLLLGVWSDPRVGHGGGSPSLETLAQCRAGHWGSNGRDVQAHPSAPPYPRGHPGGQP